MRKNPRQVPRWVRFGSLLMLALVFGSLGSRPGSAASGQIAAYALDAGSGSVAADSSGNGLNGTLHGATWTTGKYGKGLSFNGNGNYVDLGNPSALQLTSSSTWSAWVYATGDPADDGQIIAKSNDSKGWQLKTSPDTGAHRFAVDLGASVQRNSNIIRQLNTWYHVAGVYNATARTLDIYVNGVLDDGILTGTVPASNPNASVSAAIGRRTGGSGYYFQGVIDEVRVYNRALSQAEIQSDMNAPVGNPVVDTTAPVVALTAPTAGQLLPNTTVSVTASASDNVAVAGVQFLLDGANLGAEDTTSPYAVSWNTAGVANGAHTLSARARDAAGNATSSATVGVTVDTQAPTGSVVVNGGAAAAASTSAALTLNATDPGGSVAQMRFSNDGANFSAPETYATSKTWVLSAGDGLKTVFAQFKDAAGNWSASVSDTITLDTTAPVISNVSTAGTATDSRSVSWTTNEPATSQVEYGTTAAYGTLTPLDASLVTSHTVGLSNLAAGTTYHYRVRSADALGNERLGSDAVFTTPTTVDTAPPSVPSGLAAAPVSSVHVDLSWNASTDNVGVAGYRIFRNGAQVATSGTTAYQDDGLTPATSYTYAVSAFDAAGNVSATGTSIIAVTFQAPQLATPGPLRVLVSNPRYFTDGTGKAVYLNGSHTWSNLLDRGTIASPPPFDYDGYMAFMAAHGFNFMRLWTAGMTNVGNADPNIQIVDGSLPWGRTGPGTANDGRPKFDLNRFDQVYFDRLRDRAIKAGKNGVYVAVQLFDGYNPEFGDSPADGNPFGLSNNVNAIDCAGTCSQDASRITPAAWAVERAYIRKVSDTLGDLDNVIYEVANEAGDAYSTAWQYNVINEMKQDEASRSVPHPVGMTYQYLNGGSGDAPLYNGPADWISTGAQLPAGTGAKVIVTDTDHAYGWAAMKSDGLSAQRKWVWKNFMNGNGTAFMDPYLVVWSGRNAPGGSTSDPGIGMTPDPYWNVIRDAMRDTASYANRVDLAAMAPTPSCSSTGFCLTHAGTEYLVYQPGSGAFTASPAPGLYAYEWFNAAAGTVAQTGTVSVTGTQTFTPPFAGDGALYLKKTADTQAPSVPTGLAAAPASSSQINLSWNASTDNVAVTGYHVFRNGTQIAAPSTTTYQDTGLNAGTSYLYTVSAFDAAGNGSAQSATATATTPVVTGPAYPLKIGADGRHLVDQNDVPFLVQGDSAWSLIASPTEAEADQYLENRRQKGFNATIVNLLEHKFTTNAPNDAAGDGPFLVPGDFSTPNEAYFAHADRVIQDAASKGVMIMLAPAYLGFRGEDEGWFQEMTANGPAKMRDYGRYIGNRYKNFPNILWVEGGDFNPSDHSVVEAVAQGIAETDPNHLHTAHCERKTSSLDCYPSSSWLSVNTSYTDYVTYDHVLRDYNRASFKPTFLIEAVYENEGQTNPTEVRAEAYRSVLSGSQGQTFGNNPIWVFNGPPLSTPPYTWQVGMDAQGSRDMVRVTALFAGRDWTHLVPDQNHSVVTAGFGTYITEESTVGNNYATTASTPDGRLSLTYMPTRRTVTVNMSKFSGPVTARWYDPTNGNSATISGSPFSNSGSRQFVPTGNNASGAGDWVLVLEVTGPDTSAPSVPANLTAAPASSTQINLSWSASTDNVGVAGYRVFRGGTQVATSTATTYQDSGLAPSTSYAYSVSAFDAAGNASALSASATGTTSAGVSQPQLGAHVLYAQNDTFGTDPAVTPPITTQASGSTLLAMSLGWLRNLSTPTDTYNNVWTQLSGPNIYFSPDFYTALWASTSAAGGTGHRLTFAKTSYPAGEISMPLIEVKNGGQVSQVYALAPGSNQTPGSITVDGPATLIAVWAGDSAELNHTAVPDNGFSVIDSYLSFGTNGETGVQAAVAVKQVSAPGTYTVHWTSTPVQKCACYLIAVLNGTPPPPPDTQVPSVPTNLSGTAVSSSQINLAWTASTDNVGVAGYGIYRDNVQVATSTAATYQDTGLAANTTHSYAVDAFDAAGNRSARSTAVNVTTFVQGVSAPTFVQSRSKSVTGGTSNALAFSSPIGAGHAVVVYVQSDTPIPATVTDSQGNVYQRALSTPWANNAWGAQVFYAANVVGGADTVTATFAAPVTSFGLIYIQDYDGVDPVNPLDGAVAAQGSGSSFSSGNLTTTAANDLLFGAAGSEMNVTGAGSGFTARNSTFGNMIEDRTAPAAGAYALTGTHDASLWVSQLIALRGR